MSLLCSCAFAGIDQTPRRCRRYWEDALKWLQTKASSFKTVSKASEMRRNGSLGKPSVNGKPCKRVDSLLNRNAEVKNAYTRVIWLECNVSLWENYSHFTQGLQWPVIHQNWIDSFIQQILVVMVLFLCRYVLDPRKKPPIKIQPPFIRPNTSERQYTIKVSSDNGIHRTIIKSKVSRSH